MKAARNNRRGFSLIEVLLVVTTITVLSGISLPVYYTFHEKSNLLAAKEMTLRAIRRAQSLSMTGEHDATWGVFLGSGTITLFSGSSFSGRDTSFDETFEFSATIIPSGVTELTFEPLTGKPSTTGQIILTHTHHETTSIFIHAKGIASY